MNRAVRIGFIVVLVFGAVGLYAWFQPAENFTLERLKTEASSLAARRDAAPWAFAASYFAVYVILTSLAIPGAQILTMAGGALFGLWHGALLVSFASTIGATFAFLASRYLFQDLV